MIFFARLVPADLIGEERTDRTPVASCSSVVELADRSPVRVHALILESVQPAHLQIPLADPQVARELRIIAANLLDEVLGVLAPNEGLDGVAQRVAGA